MENNILFFLLIINHCSNFFETETRYGYRGRLGGIGKSDEGIAGVFEDSLVETIAIMDAITTPPPAQLHHFL